MPALAALRRLLARRPWLYWLLVAGCALLIGWSLHRAEVRADNERAGWGSTRTVWVTTTAVERGQAIHAAARQWPAAMVPASALTKEPEAPAAHALARGELLVAGDLATSTASGDNWVVVPVSRDLAPEMLAGDGVVVIGNGADLCAGVVDAVRDDVVEIAVPRGCAAELSVHAVAGTLLLARLL